MGSTTYIYKEDHEYCMKNKTYRERYNKSIEYKVFRTKQAAKVDAYNYWFSNK